MSSKQNDAMKHPPAVHGTMRCSCCLCTSLASELYVSYILAFAWSADTLFRTSRNDAVFFLLGEQEKATNILNCPCSLVQGANCIPTSLNQSQSCLSANPMQEKNLSPSRCRSSKPDSGQHQRDFMKCLWQKKSQYATCPKGYRESAQANSAV